MTELRHGTPEEAGLRPDRIARIREQAAGWVEDGLTSALVLLAARRGVVCLHEAWGVLDGNRGGPPLTPDAVFPMSSLSKPVTAAAVMSLVEEGEISLTRPLRRYLPEVCGEGAEEILVHHLLTHTSGFTDESLNEFELGLGAEHPALPDREPTQHPDVQKYLHLRCSQPLALAPGTQNSYCQLNYELLGELARRISGQAFEELVRDRVLAPLGMNDSSYRLEDHLSPRLVIRPDRYPLAKDSAIVNLNDRNRLDAPLACGGLLSTAWDQAVFLQLFLNGGIHAGSRLLSPRTVEAMTQNQIPGIGAQISNTWLREGSWAYGFMVQAAERLPWVGSLQPEGSFYHTGVGTCGYWAEPESALLGVYLSTDATFDEDAWETDWRFPMFQNMLTSAVERVP